MDTKTDTTYWLSFIQHDLASLSFALEGFLGKEGAQGVITEIYNTINTKIPAATFNGSFRGTTGREYGVGSQA